MKSHFLDIFQLDDRATLAKKPRDRMNALLEAKDTAAAVQALDPIEFYDLYHAVGPADAMAFSISTLEILSTFLFIMKVLLKV